MERGYCSLKGKKKKKSLASENVVSHKTDASEVCRDSIHRRNMPELYSTGSDLEYALSKLSNLQDTCVFFGL